MNLEIPYHFENGIVNTHIADITDPLKPVIRSIWSDKLTKAILLSIMDEYVEKCIPIAYQKIADFTHQVTMWIDPHTGQTKVFKPKTVIN